VKTSAEEELMRKLEQIVTTASEKMTRSEFKKRTAWGSQTARDVIRRHRRMISLWTAMNRRITNRAQRLLDKSYATDQWPVGKGPARP
jgi:hypothetical protein